MIYVVNKKRKDESIKKEFPNADILDLTSKSEYAKVLSPFYPHGNIPIPFTEGLTATCVEAVWQGMKVFETYGVDFNTFRNDTMQNLKRTVRKYGAPKGHLKGAFGNELLNYFDARMLIYLPTYKYVLDNVPRVQHILKRIKERSIDHDLVFLDYNTNTDVRDISQPLSHAGLVKLYIEDRYPEYDPSIRPMTKEEVEDKRQRQKEEKKARTTKHKRNSSTDNRPGNDSTCSSSDKNDFQEELFPSSFFESK